MPAGFDVDREEALMTSAGARFPRKAEGGGEALGRLVVLDLQAEAERPALRAARGGPPRRGACGVAGVRRREGREGAGVDGRGGDEGRAGAERVSGGRAHVDGEVEVGGQRSGGRARGVELYGR